MKQMLVKDWKTTISGLVIAVASFVVAYSGDLHAPALLVDLAKFTMAGGFVTLGLVSKDSNKSQ